MFNRFPPLDLILKRLPAKDRKNQAIINNVTAIWLAHRDSPFRDRWNVFVTIAHAREETRYGTLAVKNAVFGIHSTPSIIKRARIRFPDLGVSPFESTDAGRPAKFVAFNSVYSATSFYLYALHNELRVRHFIKGVKNPTVTQCVTALDKGNYQEDKSALKRIDYTARLLQGNYSPVGSYDRLETIFDELMMIFGNDKQSTLAASRLALANFRRTNTVPQNFVTIIDSEGAVLHENDAINKKRKWEYLTSYLAQS